jgi:polysaccharide biosynthesis/export protein
MKLNNASLPTFPGALRLGLAMLSIVTIGICPNSGIRAQDRRPDPRQYSQSGQPVNDTYIPNIIVSPGENYRIGPSDVLEILIEDAPELSRTLRVSADGTVMTPFLGRVPAQDKTADELAQTIANRLRGEYLEDPQVTVTVRQINSRTYFVQGAVRRAGLYQIEGQPSLLKLITIAGGLTENYGSTAFIIREINAIGDQGVRNDAGSQDSSKPIDSNGSQLKEAGLSGTTPNSASTVAAKYELVKVNINGLLRGNFDQNVMIVPGDIVHIPPTDVFFVAGEVNAPGSFALKEGTTLRQAISLAQGANFNAAADRGIIFREDPATGKRDEIKVDIPAVMNGKKPDIPIAANDIVIVPNSRLKSIGGTLLRAFGVNSARIPLPYRF